MMQSGLIIQATAGQAFLTAHQGSRGQTGGGGGNRGQEKKKLQGAK